MEAAPEGLEREHPVGTGMSAPWSSVVLRGRKLLIFLNTTEHGAPRSISTEGSAGAGIRARGPPGKCSVCSVVPGGGRTPGAPRPAAIRGGRWQGTYARHC